MEKTKKIDFGSGLDHAKEEAKAWKTICLQVKVLLQ